MEQCRARFFGPYILVGCAAVFGMGVAGRAAIIATDGEVLTTVQELIDGQPGSVNSDREALDGDSSRLPLVASSALTSTDLSGTLISLGQSAVELADPYRLDQPNPEEFALEVACYSNAESVSYSVTGLAREMRTVVFTGSSDSPVSPEIEFGPGSRREVESRVFLSGAVVIWSVEALPDLAGISAELRVTITGQPGRRRLFETGLVLGQGAADPGRGTSTGPIRFEQVGLDELIEAGIDDRTAQILQSVADDGTLIVFVIPPQEHTYIYSVTADEPLTLTAEFEARVRNVPGKTGVAAAWGRPFSGLAEFIAHGLPGVDGQALQRSVNLAMARRGPVRNSPDTRLERVLTGPICGALGIVPLAVIGLGLFLMGGQRARGFPFGRG